MSGRIFLYDFFVDFFGVIFLYSNFVYILESLRVRAGQKKNEIPFWYLVFLGWGEVIRAFSGAPRSDVINVVLCYPSVL